MEGKKKLFSKKDFIFACGLAFVGVGFALGGLFVSKSNQVAQEALAAYAVPYMAWDEDSKSVKSVEGGCSEYTFVDSTTTDWADGKWYVVSNDATIASRVTVKGTANLILCDGATLTANDGISVNNGNTLNIYGQSKGTGSIIATATSIKCAGIGGNNESACGTISIHGGTITATGKRASAGIGGGYYGDGGSITIYDGNITANGGDWAAGIGGGDFRGAGTITIYGGNIVANGGYGGAGLGCGDDIESNPKGTITIHGGVITATGGENAAGIDVDTLTVNNNDLNVLGNNSETPIFPRDAKTATEYQSNAWKYMIVTKIVNYQAWDGTSVTDVESGCLEYKVITEGFTNLTTGWYVVDSDVPISSRVNVTGTANLILCDGFTLTVNGGITVSEGNTLNIYGQTNGTGTLLCTNTLIDAAGIGGYDDGDAGTVNIHGGNITASGGSNGGAGIGGGAGGNGGTVTIYGGTVNAIATANSYLEPGAGIGGGNMSNGGTVTILGGFVNARGYQVSQTIYSAGIGHGAYGSGDGTLTVGDGLVVVCESTIVEKVDDDYARSVNMTVTSKANVTFNTNGGTINSGDFDVYGEGIVTPLPTNVTRTDYVFDGWYTDSELTEGPITEISADARGDKEFWAKWKETIPYYAWDEDSKTIKPVPGGCSEYTIVESTTTDWTDGKWYVVNSDVTIENRISVSGTANLILCDNSKLTAKNGIGLSNNANINIFAQSEGENAGILIAGGENISDGFAAIGGNNEGVAGNITIHGGNITATGGKFAAGIGGGQKASVGAITINGGAITATGGDAAFGIDNGGAGIGGGGSSNFASITISNQVTSLTATIVTDYAYDTIGRGGSNNSGSVTFCGDNNYIYENPFIAPTITFNLNGGEFSGAAPRIYKPKAGVTLPTKITKDNHTFVGWYDNENFEGAPVTQISSSESGNKEFWAKWEKNAPVSYIERSWDSTNKTVVDTPKICNDNNIVKNDTTVWSNGWYVVNSNVTFDYYPITVTGTVNLILCDGCTLTANNGINVSEGNSLSIYSQTNGTGEIVTHNDKYWYNYAAGIGGSEGGNGGTVTIHGGKITATGNQGGAGIGGTVTIYGGTVTANGKGGGAGISGTVTIYGGEVTATSLHDAGAGIGGGTVTIFGGTVTANGGFWAAGIGGGNNDDGGEVTISGGTVTANGGGNGAGIGGGDHGKGGTVTISGGTVTAIGGNNGAGIGGGYDGEGGTVTISGGKVFAYGGNNATGIGRGWVQDPNKSNGTLTVSTTDVYKVVEITNKNKINVLEEYATTRTQKMAVSTLTPLNLVTNGGQYIETPLGKYLEGYSSALPTSNDITRAGLDFMGWYADDNASAIGRVTAIPADATGELTYYAKWGNYYLVGSMNDNKIDEDYKLSFDSKKSEYYIYLNQLKTTDTFRIAIGNPEDGVVGALPLLSEDPYSVTKDGAYRLYFHPEGDGTGEEWLNPYIKLQEYIPYYAWDEEAVKEVPGGCADFTILDNTMTSLEDGKWYVVNSNVTIDDRITVTGTVNLILCDGYTLTASNGIKVISGNTLNIFGQASDTGALIATSTNSNAAIGGDNDSGNAGTVNIHGGKITATCEVDAAGIGGGYNGKGGSVAIYGGNVTASSYGAGAGIGGGYNGEGGTVTINGGNVTAKGGVCGAGIGGGFYGKGGTVTINGGNVTASSFSDGAGIGGGSEASGGSVTINGGRVFAKGITGIGKGNIGSSDGDLSIATGKGFIVCDGTTIYAIDNSFPRSEYMAVTVLSPVTFNTNGGTINTGSYTQYPEGVPYLLPTDVTKDNYDFAGWYANADFTGRIYTTIPTDATGAKEYYARWGSYYLVGNMTNWEIDPQYKLTLNSESSTLEYTIDIPLKTTDSFKIAFGSTDGIDQWYPVGTGNAYGDNGEITFDSNYRIHFRPYGDGEGWFHNVIYVQSPTILVGDTKYFTLKEAYEAVSENGTIKLLDDINISNEADDYLIIGKNFTLDLNGHILDITSEVLHNKYKVKVLDGAILTVDDSSANVGGVKGVCGVDYANSSYILLKNIRLSLDVESIKEGSEIMHVAEGFILVQTNNGAPDTDGFLSLVRPMNDQDYADEVDALIAQIGTVEYTPESFNLIKEARDAYKELTEDQQALVSKLDVLVAGEEAYAGLATDYIDDKLNIQTITLDNKDDIVAARTAYNALTDEEKAEVPVETLNKLLAAEKEIKDIEESNASIALIEALPEVGVLTLDDKEEVEAARAAYEALSVEGKEKVSGTVLDKLLAAEKEIKDIEDSNALKASIDALPSLDDLTVDDKELVYGIDVAYKSLSTEAKAKVSSDYVNKLQQAYAKVKELVDIKESSEVTELIEDLPDVSEVTLDDKDAIDQVREEYRGLSPEGKDMISEEDLIKLVNLEKAIDDILSPANVNKAIDELPSLDELTLDDKDAVLAAEKAYDRLSPEGKKDVPAEKAAKVKTAVERIAQLEKEKEEQEIEDFVSLVESLPSPENVTLDDAEKVMEAYRNQKKFYGKVPESLMNQLDLVYRALEILQGQAEIGRVWYVDYTYDWIGGFFERPDDVDAYINDDTLVSITPLANENMYRFTFSGKNTYNFDLEVAAGKVPTGLYIASGLGQMNNPYVFGIIYEMPPVVSANIVTLTVEEKINYVVGRVVTVNAIFEPAYTTNQEVKWSVSGEGILLYEDSACTILVSENTTQKTVYAKFVASGEYDIVAIAKNDESIEAVLTINVTETDPMIGRKWFIGDSFEVDSSFWYRYYSGYGSNLAKKDLNGAILVSINNTQGYNTCYFIYEKPVGGDDDFSLDIDNPEILPTGLTFVSGDGTHDNPYVVNAIYDEPPYVGVKDIDLSVSTIQYAFVEGQVAILDASINPHYAFNQNVIWTVSSDSVVLYEDFECTTPLTNGITDIHKVYAKAEKAGKAIVYVKSADNGAANAAYVVDVIAKEGLVPFEYTLWTTYSYNKTWSKAYLEVRDAETGEAAARLTLTGDRDREDYLDVNHDKWGTSDTIYLPFGKNYELVWSKTPYDGGWDDKYYYFTFNNPTTIDLIADMTDMSCASLEQDQVVASFLSTTEPIVRIELSNDSLAILDGKVTVVTPYVKPGAVENKTLTWSINKEGVVSLFADSSCTESLPAVIDSGAPIYVKGLEAGVATITLTSVQDNSKVVYIPVIVYDSAIYTTIKYDLNDQYSDGWNGAVLSIVNTKTGKAVETLTIENGNHLEGELTIINDEYNLVWSKGSFDEECSFVLYDSDDNVLLDSSTVTLNEGVLATIGTPIEDSIIASATEKLINSLHEVKDIKIFEKQEIQLVRDYYDNLTKEQQELISGDILAKLVAAEKEINDIETSTAVDQLINELPVFKDIVLDDKDQIMAAKEAYDALSDEAKAKLPKEDVEALNAAVKEINDIEESNASTEEINALPVVGELTLNDKDVVTKARADYDALSDEAKAKVDPEVLDKLQKAEVEIKDIETAKDADDKINALPVIGELTLEDKADVEAAKAAYDALTDYQKGKVSIEDVAKLNAAVKEISDIETAKDADDKINALPVVGELTLEDKADVEAARAAYDALTDYQKGKVSTETLAKLVAAETEIKDIEAAKETSDKINALPVVGVLTLEDKADVEAARAAYDALTEYQKGKVSIEDVAKLNAAVKEINDIEAAKAAGEQIDELPSLDDITGMDEKDVDAAQAAIDALTPEAIAKLTDEELAKLEEAKAAIAEIKSIVVTEDSGNKSFTRDVDAKAAEEDINVKQTFKVAANDEAKNKELTIKAGDVTVSFDANAINEIGNKATTFTVKLTYLKQGPEAKVDVSLNGVKFDTGISTVSFKYQKSIPVGMQAVVRYVDAEGNKTTMKTWMENGVISFETNHFSTFIVEYELSAGAIALIIVGSILAFLLLVGIVLFILDRMHVIHIAFIDRLFDKKAKEEQPVEQVQENEVSNEENEEVVTVTDEKGNIFQIRFIKSFTAKLIQSPDETKKYYEVLKNYVLSYKKTNSRVSWHFDSINTGREKVLKFAIRGKTLGVYYALNADDYADSKYKVEKVESKKYEDVPCLYRIKNDRRCEYAKELIDVVMTNLGLVKGEEQKESYYLHYEENKPLIARGLIKELKVQVNKPASETQILSVVTDEDGEEVVTKRDSKGNIFQIRYIKSFTAKLSQADDELKDYYNELKNYALSYKKTNSRISWHFDSVNVGRNQVLKFVIRGKTLCLYYALNADDYTESKYKVEKVESKKYEEVPCLYRIKNDRRRDYAKDLIDVVMANVPTEKGKESNEDFRVPYETTEALLEKGLIKEVKTKVETKDEKAIQSITVVEADKQMSDEKAEEAIVEDYGNKKHEGKKGIINIDTISENFNDGDTVDIEALYKKKLIPSNVGFVKVLARGSLNKKLHLALQDYSLQAVKMIILAGGTVKKTN